MASKYLSIRYSIIWSALEVGKAKALNFILLIFYSYLNGTIHVYRKAAAMLVIDGTCS